jgi:hypothetical protein
LRPRTRHCGRKNDRLRESLATERQAVNEISRAGQVTSKVLDALAGLAADRSGQRHQGVTAGGPGQ